MLLQKYFPLNFVILTPASTAETYITEDALKIIYARVKDNDLSRMN